MDEFEKIKTFSEGLAERQQNVAQAQQPSENSDIDFPQYLSTFRAQPIQEEKESKTLMWVVLGLSAVVTLIVMALLFPRLTEMENHEVMVIAPTPEPVKVLPENPGGLSIPDRDKVVYERREVTEPAPVVENLFPEPEQPLLPTAVIEPENKEEMPLILVEQPEEVSEPEPEVPLVLEEVPAEMPMESAPEMPEAQNPAVEEVLPPEPVVEPVPEQPVVPKNTEIWRAQLLSSSDKKKVESSWKTILKQQATLLSDMPYQIVSATIAGKGTFWRLQVGEFATKEMAQNLCAKLKQKKQDCIAVK